MGKTRRYRNRHFRSEGLMGRGTLVTENPLLANAEEDPDLVIKDTCNECPEDSAGILYKGRCKCMCTHFPNEPLRKNMECRRNTVEGYPRRTNSSTSTGGIPVDVIIDRKGNGTSGAALDSFGHAYAGSSSLVGHALQITLLFTLILICVLAIVFVIFCIVRRRSLMKCLSRFSAQNRMEMKSAASGRLLPDRFVNNPTYETTCLDLSIRIYSADEIKLLTQIGQGCFGKVFKGELNGEVMAVKMVRSEHSSDALKEIETMACFAHPNILPLLGIAKSPEADAPWLLFEFMEYGDLASVLRRSSFRPPGNVGVPTASSTSSPYPKGSNDEIVSRNSKNSDEEEKLAQFPLTPDMLVNVAMQISEGMKYLSIQHFVHRDLAARNCLMSANGVVKISDFGLSRDVYTCDYYKIGGSKLLPIRWMAPESILYGCFTLESDVWAYGTVLWEIYTWGKQPYFGHSNEEVVQLILDGVLLCPPSDCPPLIQEIMAGCWKTESKDRLTFRQIHEKFVKAGYGRRSQDDNDSEGFYEIPRKLGESKIEDGLLQSSQHPFDDNNISSLIDSGYEIPIRRPANEVEYLQVV